MTERERELTIQLATMIGALKALAPKENGALQTALSIAEDVLHGPER